MPKRPYPPLSFCKGERSRIPTKVTASHAVKPARNGRTGFFLNREGTPWGGLRGPEKGGTRESLLTRTWVREKNLQKGNGVLCRKGKSIYRKRKGAISREAREMAKTLTHLQFWMKEGRRGNFSKGGNKGRKGK